MIVRPFLPDDIEQIAVQPAQAHMRPLISGKGYGQVLASGEAWERFERIRLGHCLRRHSADARGS